MKLFFIPFLLAMTTTSFCQTVTSSVIAVAGAVSKSDKIQLEWTIGEPVVETGATSNTLLTQGFHQPLLLVKPVSPAEHLPVATRIAVFPNPTASAVTVQLLQKAEKPIEAVLVDNWGRVLTGTKKTVNTTSFSLDLRLLSQGTYFLRLMTSDGVLLSHYKVVKIN